MGSFAIGFSLWQMEHTNNVGFSPNISYNRIAKSNLVTSFTIGFSPWQMEQINNVGFSPIFPKSELRRLIIHVEIRGLFLSPK